MTLERVFPPPNNTVFFITYDIKLAVTGNQLTTPIPILSDLQDAMITDWFAIAGTPPTGSDLILQPTKNGNINTNLTIPDGWGKLVQTNIVKSKAVNKNDLFNLNITQIGSVFPGANVYLGARVTYTPS